MAATIRELSSEEWAVWAHLREASRAYQSQHVKGEFTMQHPEEQPGDYRAWGVEVERKIVGYLIVMQGPRDSDAKWRVLDSYVDEAHRRKGYATAIHRRALDDLGVNRETGPVAINPPVQPEAQGVLTKVLGPKCVVIVRSVSKAWVTTEKWDFEDFIKHAASRFLK